MFNATITGQPYKRIMRIEIDYPAPLTANVVFHEQEHVKLSDGTHRALGGVNAVSFQVTPSDLGQKVPLLDINTGEPLGAEMSYQQIMLGVLAAIRAHEA